MKISLLTVHDASSQRKVDFHFWSDVFAARRHDINFVSVGFSPITFFKKDGRRYGGPFNRWITINSNVRKFLWCAPFHPFRTDNALLDKMVWLPFSFYSRLIPSDLMKGLAGTDIFIVENGPGLMLIPALARKFPKAKFVYSVCDRLETLCYHPIIMKAEKEAMDYLDLIRVPAQVMIGDYPSFPNTRYIPHGLDKKNFDGDYPNPYASGKNAVSVGDSLFDPRPIVAMARAFPDWTFHLFGKGAKIEEDLKNVVTHGEKPFAELTPYIVHADIGIAPYRPAPEADFMSQSSMKMIQYSYCRLPIIAPDFAASGRAHVCAYDPDNMSTVIGAFNKAILYDRSTIDPSTVMDWENAVDAIMAGVGSEELRQAS